MSKYAIFCLLILNSFLISSQEVNDLQIVKDSLEIFIKNRETDKALLLLKSIPETLQNEDFRYDIIHKNIFYCYYLQKKYDSCKSILDIVKLYKNALSPKHLSNYYLNNAYYFKEKNNLDSSVYYYTKSLHFFERDTSKNITERANIYAGLASVYSQTKNSKKHLFYLKRYLNEAKKSKNDYKIGAALNNLGVFYDKNQNPEKALFYFKKSLKFKLRNTNRNSVLQNIGSIYLNYYNNSDSASYYNKKAINEFTSNRTLAHIHYDLSVIEKRRKNYQKENTELLEALSKLKTDPFVELELSIYKNLYLNFVRLNSIDRSVFYLKKYDSLNEKFTNDNLIRKTEEIETQYQVEKKEVQIENLKHLNTIASEKAKAKQNQIIALTVFIILGFTTTYLILKNSRKKRLLAEQEKDLEQQKNLTLLKEQEITAINAMIDGQEKERIRIAEDLHDNIGSVLATLKLHFENLQLNRDKKQFDQDVLFQKTETLIDEAYLKIRSIAHAKNSGVIANQGLLVAVKLMAEKISSANKIQINVIDFGLNNRLENSLEIALFRIIQELVTNVIKHAKATEVNINISQFDDHINLIVEDNGIGFNYNAIDHSQGMGLGSIEKRVDHLEGSFEIDSTTNKGTSIIIDFPINNT
ncbi:tetratricopeptide repeat-containing sensor histidine kinase [Tenacibaculum xiamenense]|uniref:tetratricopeptide repeat-containing sensor histidine kinase n=1 Tax=Tenacibaculum xiamenense TaxID=1261553 RepID=UPI003892DB8D